MAQFTQNQAGAGKIPAGLRVALMNGSPVSPVKARKHTAYCVAAAAWLCSFWVTPALALPNADIVFVGQIPNPTDFASAKAATETTWRAWSRLFGVVTSLCAAATARSEFSAICRSFSAFS